LQFFSHNFFAKSQLDFLFFSTHVAIVFMDGKFRCLSLFLFYINTCKSCISSLNHFILFPLQMLGFFNNYKFAIHFQSLQFWLVCCCCTKVLSGGASFLHHIVISPIYCLKSLLADAIEGFNVKAKKFH
jgi:hypothetical protein